MYWLIPIITAGAYVSFKTSIPVFYTKTQTSDFFRKDPDGYVEMMTLLDVKAQGAKSKLDFINKICNAADNFTIKEKALLIRACTNADYFFKNEMPDIEGIDKNIIVKIPWKLTLTRGKANEEGLPHTRQDIIFLSDQVLKLSLDMITRTMIHEKIHVYERLYPHLIQKWMNSEGYIRHRRLNDLPYARSNPDVDGWTYIDPKGSETVVNYRTDNPTSIDDVYYPHDDHPNSEHPYETIAYRIDAIYGQIKKMIH